MLETFTCATFATHVGDTFRLSVDGGQGFDAILADASELPMASARPGRVPFSIVFLGPPEVHPQGTYRTDHPVIGSFELFVVPIGADGGGVRYEAVFT